MATSETCSADGPVGDPSPISTDLQTADQEGLVIRRSRRQGAVHGLARKRGQRLHDPGLRALVAALARMAARRLPGEPATAAHEEGRG